IEQRQDGARLAAGRIFGDVCPRPFEIFGGECEAGGLLERAGSVARVHRSISPKTMSIEPMIATRSASIWPRDRNSVACSIAKPGARILQRNGRLVPSATRYTANSPFGASTAV